MDGLKKGREVVAGWISGWMKLKWWMEEWMTEKMKDGWMNETNICGW